MKKFGKDGAHKERYDVGSSAHASERERLLRPIKGHGGRWETSKPVAQTIASKAWCVPEVVVMPVGVTVAMDEDSRITLGRVKDSR